jgi:type IV pilus assembly protein PilA
LSPYRPFMRARSEKRSPQAFTLLELMLVVSIIGILASVAVPAFSRYLKRAKTTEAYMNVRKIYDGQVTLYMEEHVDAAGALKTKKFAFLPPQPPWPPEEKRRFGNFEMPGWRMVKFSTDGPLLYSYMCEVHPSGGTGLNLPGAPVLPEMEEAPESVIAAFQVRAMGDIDGDRKYSVFERTGYVEREKGEVEGFPGIFTLDELE